MGLARQPAGGAAPGCPSDCSRPGYEVWIVFHSCCAEVAGSAGDDRHKLCHLADDARKSIHIPLGTNSGRPGANSCFPYQYVRHPMYAAIIVYILSLTLLLDSIWALIPAGMVILVYLIRTHLEDRML